MSGLLVLLVLAGLLFAFGLFGIWHGLSSRSWPSVVGRVLEASVLEHQVVSRLRYSIFVPCVRFEYQAGGRSYTSTRISTIAFDHSSTDRERVLAFLEAYVPGAEVTVRFKAEEPSFGVLLPKASFRAVEHYLVWTLVGAMVLFVGSFVIQIS